MDSKLLENLAMTIENLTTLMGWCALLNIGLLATSTVGLVVGKRFATSIHSRLFDLDETELAKAYFQYLANYKIATLVFNVIPYIALKLMTTT
ncbi:MAG: DUF6868 family protein [Rubripirellula sp.]